MNIFNLYNPISFTLFDETIEATSKYIESYFNAPNFIRVNKGWTKNSGDIAFKSPCIGELIECLVWKPRNCNMTVFQSKSVEGDAHAMWLLSRRYSVRILHVNLSSEGNAYLKIYDNHEDVRYIQTACIGGRWIFSQGGAAQFFENPGYYKRRKIRDRFNREILCEYMLKLGIDVQSDEFWKTDIEPYYYVMRLLAERENLRPYNPVQS